MAYTEVSMFWDGKDIGHAALVAPYDETEFDDFFELINRSYGNVGVVIGYDNELAVTAPGVNSIQVATGRAAVKGKGYWLKDGAKPLVAVSAPSTVRWDYVILRTTWSAKTVEATIRQGTAGGPPSLVQSDGVTWEIPLAYYKIDTSGNITDLTDTREFLGCNVDDAVNNDITDVQEFAHGAPSPAAGIGTAVRFKADTDADRPRLLGRLAMLWDVVADATRQSLFKMYLYYGGTRVEAAVIKATNTVTGYVAGGTRGSGAVDLQGLRLVSDQIASGNFSVIGGGQYNKVSANQGTVGGGVDNVVTAVGATIAGGISNVISQVYGAIGGGQDNITSGTAATIPGGQENEASGNLSVAMGKGAVADKHGQVAQANGYFANPGDAQGTVQVIMRLDYEHSDTNFHEIFLDGSSARLTIAPDTVWTYRIDIVATTDGGGGGMDVASYSIVGNIENDNGVTTVNLATVTTLYEDIAGWDVQINTAASTTNDALVVEVKDGTASRERIRWVARVELTEVTWPGA